MILKYCWERIIGDVVLLLLAVLPASIAFYTDTRGLSNGLFLRCGAIMVLFAASLEFRTHEMIMQAYADSFSSMHRTMMLLGEFLSFSIKTNGKSKAEVQIISHSRVN